MLFMSICIKYIQICDNIEIFLINKLFSLFILIIIYWVYVYFVSKEGNVKAYIPIATANSMQERLSALTGLVAIGHCPSSLISITDNAPLMDRLRCDRMN